MGANLPLPGPPPPLVIIERRHQRRCREADRRTNPCTGRRTIDAPPQDVLPTRAPDSTSTKESFVANLTISNRSAADTAGDALVVALVPGDGGATLAPGHGLPRKTVAHLKSVVTDLELAGKVGEVTTLAAVPEVAAKLVVLAGVGALSGATPRPSRTSARASAARIRSLEQEEEGRRRRARHVGRPRRRRRRGRQPRGVCRVEGRHDEHRRGRVDLDRRPCRRRVAQGRQAAAALGEAVAYTRDLVNLPPNLLYPETSSTPSPTIKGSKVKLKSYDMKALRSGGFGGTVGVGQGSANEPRIAVLSYSPAQPKATIAFVGKGITFDSGGLCIKPATGMLTMKSDMAGAAAVAGAVLAIAELGLPIAVTGYLDFAENMPSSTAQRPSDVVTMRGGKTVEVLNTDAEGRMVLGDCISLASEELPDAIVDVATLTGAGGRARPHRRGHGQRRHLPHPRARCRRHGRRGRVADAAAQGAAPGARLVNADIAHIGGSEGGMLTAGIFLSEFVGEGIPGHLDIAGPAFNDKGATGYWPKGGTGFGVRTLVGLAESYL